MQTRLLQTGLVERPERCLDVGHGWRFLRIGSASPGSLPELASLDAAL